MKQKAGSSKKKYYEQLSIHKFENLEEMYQFFENHKLPKT